MAIAASWSVSSREPTNFAASWADSRQSSQMFRPPTVTASDSGRSRAPLQAGHGTSRKNCSMRSRVVSDSASCRRRSSQGTTPSKVVWYWRVRP